MPSISLPSPHTASERVLIYFICGNPGVISYYNSFFSLLRGLIDQSQISSAKTSYDLYGRSLLGFDDDDHKPFSKQNLPYDLDGQIEGLSADIANQKKDGKLYDKVILMGHSVGAYLSVEIMHRIQQDPSKTPGLNLQHGFLLFPTLTSIALSPQGKKATWAFYVPFLEGNAHTLAQWLLSCVSKGTLTWLVKKVTGFEEEGVETTVDWLKSRDGVWQALHLAGSEMRTICEEKWTDELWECSDSSKVPKFFIFYGKNDHWVANEIRDAFIEKRGKQASISVDEGNLPHAFCTHECKSSQHFNIDKH